MKKTPSRVLIVVILLAIVIFMIWRAFQPHAIEVALTSVENGKVESIVTNTRAGTINACRRARLAPTIGGPIAQLLVREGAKVTSNQVLLEMWNEDIKAQLLLAKQQAKAAHATAKEVCVNAKVAHKEAARLTKLLKQKLASEGDTDRAVGQAEASAAACTAANDSAQVSDANVKVVEVALERTRLRAPFDGIVAEVNGEVGEFITPSPVGVPTLPAVDLIDNTCIYVTAPIDEVDVPQIKPDMPTRITLDAFKGHPFSGFVKRVAPYVLDREKQARTVDIEVNFSHVIGEQNLLPGYSADVEIIIAEKASTLRIPTEALFEGNYVYIYEAADGTLHKRNITTGISNWIYTQVTDGLQKNDRILASANVEGISDGIAVTVKTSSNETK